MSTSFIDGINFIQTTLLNDAALKAFSLDSWNKAPMILPVFKKRVEIDVRDLPIILVTRPQVLKTLLVGARDGVNTVRLYCGFLQNAREQALAQIIQFEEKIDDALLTQEATNAANAAGIKYINPKSSVNDEGMYHPVYFIAMDVEISHRRM